MKPDPTPEVGKLASDTSATVQIPTGDDVLYSTTPSPFVAVGQNKADGDARELWDLRTMTRVGTIGGKVDFSHRPTGLSPDGQYIVGDLAASRSAEIEIWSFQTGQLVRRIATHSGPMSVDLTEFAGPGQVVTLKYPEKGKVGKHFQIWDIASGQQVREFKAVDGHDNESPALSPNRRYLALVASEKVHLFDLNAGALAAELTAPKSQRVGYLDCRGLRFSPDGSELAGLFATAGETQLRSWSMTTGEVVVDHSFPADLRFTVHGSFGYKGPAIEWLPDGSAWLLYGHMIADRASGRMVWMLRSAADDLHPPPRKMLDNDHVLVASGGRKGKRLEVVTLPWPQIDAALKALAGDTPAHLRPGQAVSLDIEVAKVRQGTPEQTKAELAKTLTERLKGDGIEVAENQSTVLHVKYSEEAGATLQEMANQGGRGPGGGPGIPSPFGGVATGKTVQATKAICDVAWTSSDAPKPFWTKKIELDPHSLIVRGEASEKTARESGFGLFKSQLQQQPLPYFVPKASDVAALPGVTDLPGGSEKPDAKAAPKATPKPTKRGQQ